MTMEVVKEQNVTLAFSLGSRHSFSQEAFLPLEFECRIKMNTCD